MDIHPLKSNNRWIRWTYYLMDGLEDFFLTKKNSRF